MPSAPRSPLRPLATLLLAGLPVLAAQANESFDPLDAPLEELVKVQIISTPKFSEDPDRIPSAVTILTRQDILTFGWRTLSDALRTLQGFNVTSDYTYAYAGVRGVSPVGDFRARMQVLIDGMSINENIYASAPVDSTFPLDMGLIERIEVIRGPSAAIYGGDSMFGVINVVTRNDRQIQGSEIELAAGSGQERRGRASWGGQIEGVNLLFSASGFNAAGRSLTFNDLGTPGETTRLQGVGAEEGGNLFVRARGSDWRFSLIHSQRDRVVPTGSYGTIANDRAHVETDRYTLLDFSKDWQLSSRTVFQQRIYSGSYGYDGTFPFDYPDGDRHVLNVDKARGSWWGLENRIVTTAWTGHRWTFGLEYRANTRQDQFNYDRGYGCYGQSSVACLSDRRQSEQATLLAQDEMQLTPADTLIAGLRYDRNGAFWSPRLGFIHDAEHWGLFKLLYGTAFRLPSPYEKAYITPTYTYGNPDVGPEKMRSIEFTWEKRLSPRARLAATLYGYQIDGLISIHDTGVVENLGRLNAQGLEVDYEQQWSNGARLRGNIAVQHTADYDGHSDNSPKRMGKLNLALPTGIAALTAGLEGQWISARSTGLGTGSVASYGLVNLNLRYAPPGAGWETGLGVYNLLDHRYRDPVAPDITPSGLYRADMPQLGRSVQLRTLFRF